MQKQKDILLIKRNDNNSRVSKINNKELLKITTIY